MAKPQKRNSKGQWARVTSDDLLTNQEMQRQAVDALAQYKAARDEINAAEKPLKAAFREAAETLYREEHPELLGRMHLFGDTSRCTVYGSVRQVLDQEEYDRELRNLVGQDLFAQILELRNNHRVARKIINLAVSK